MDKEIIRSLIAGIERELENLNELKRELRDIDSYNSIVIRRSIGSILHDFYNCCERIDYLAKKFDKVVDRFIEETTKFLAFLNEELLEEA